MAYRFAAEGVNLAPVLADIEEPGTRPTVVEPRRGGARNRCADRRVGARRCAGAGGVARDEFGAVHIVCNNAGVAGGTVAHASPELWDWALGVNLYGVIHGCSTFVPIMLEQNVGHREHRGHRGAVAGGVPRGLHQQVRGRVR